VARAWNIDRELAGLGVGEKESTVLCLGCGLDTAFYRLRPSAPVHWYDLDLPRVIEVRRKLLGEEPGCTMKAGSVPDAALYRDIPVRGNLVVLATGLLYYFSEADVGRIFENIATLGGPLHLVIDYCSAQGAALANKMVIQDCPGARMIWSAEGEADIAALHPRIRRVRTYPIFRHILPLLGPEEAKMAEMSDRMKIMSFAVIELG
jgi:O-methyltransferase involved in polyketide biosynthesis